MLALLGFLPVVNDVESSASVHSFNGEIACEYLSILPVFRSVAELIV
jgi:hypothetical protein